MVTGDKNKLDRKIIEKELCSLVEIGDNSSGLVWSSDIDRYRRKGNPIGTLNRADGYWCFRFKNFMFKVHRVIWVKCKGEIPKNMVIDHIDNNRQNNRLENLRLANYKQNAQNTLTHKDSKSGIKGLCWIERDKLWKVEVVKDGVRYTKQGKNKDVLLEWLRDKREELHDKEFAKH